MHGTRPIPLATAPPWRSPTASVKKQSPFLQEFRMRAALGVLLAASLSTVALAASSPISPGEWDITIVIDSMEMPGVPAAAMQALTGQSHSMSHCVTPEEAAKGPQVLARESGGDCQFTTFSLEGGQMNAVMQCNQGGRTTTVTTNGTYTADSYSAKSDMTMTGGMKSTASVTGKRVGECKS
jgi:hypothetical protein